MNIINKGKLAKKEQINFTSSDRNRVKMKKFANFNKKVQNGSRSRLVGNRESQSQDKEGSNDELTNSTNY